MDAISFRRYCALNGSIIASKLSINPAVVQLSWYRYMREDCTVITRELLKQYYMEEDFLIFGDW